MLKCKLFSLIIIINYLISSRPLFPTGFTINCILNIDMQIVSL